MTAVAVLVAFTGVFVTAVACPVVVTDAEAVVVAVCVSCALSTVLEAWSVAAFGLLTVAVTLSDVGVAAFAFPVFVAYAVSMVIEVGVFDACITVTGTWAPATVTFVVTPSLIDATVVSCPPVVTDAEVDIADGVVFFVSVVYTVLTIAASVAGAAVTDGVAGADVCGAVVLDPVVIALTVAVAIEASVIDADVTIAGF